MTAEEALKQLVERLEFIHADPTYQSVWTLSHVHAGPYHGPQYDKELDAAKDVLTRLRAGADGWQAFLAEVRYFWDEDFPDGPDGPCAVTDRYRAAYRRLLELQAAAPPAAPAAPQSEEPDWHKALNDAGHLSTARKPRP